MTALKSTTAIKPPDHATPEATKMTFSYLDMAGHIVSDWLHAYPADNRNAEEVADAIMRCFSVERLHALVLAHLEV